MWLKKKIYIAGFTGNAAPIDGDWRTNANAKHWAIPNTLPSISDANKYFYLPASAYYVGNAGLLMDIGEYGEYWSPSADPSDNRKAYGITFGAGQINVYRTDRSIGFRVGTFE